MRFLLPLLTLAAVWGQDPTESRISLNQGVRAIQTAQYDAAVQAFQRAIDLDPDNVTARLYLATAYFQQYLPGVDSPENAQMADRAQEAFAQVLVLDPTNTVALASMASLYLNQKKWDDARGWYQRLIAADPRDADAYYRLGYIAWAEWYPAYREARDRVGLKPEDPGPIPDLVVKQDLWNRFGSRVEEGITDLRKTLALNPQYEDAMSYLNLLIRERADFRDAQEEWRQDIAVADQWIQKALETKQMKAGQQVSAPGATDPSRIRVGAAVQEQKLVRRVDPVYPALAVQARIQGIVRFSLLLSKEGTVRTASVISGHPLLVPAALEAVKQWGYRPTLLNGAPVEVATEAEVPFNLDPSIIVPR